MRNRVRYRTWAGLVLLPLALGMFVPRPASADAGWTDYGKIVELQASTKGRFIFRLQVRANPSDCRDKQWFYRDYRGMGAEQIYETLLQAVAKGLAVKVYVTGVCDLNGFSEVNAVSIAA